MSPFFMTLDPFALQTGQTRRLLRQGIASYLAHEPEHLVSGHPFTL